VEAEVRRELAQRWSVLPSSLVLQWGRPRGGQVPEGFDVVELIGHGKDGRWVVAFREVRGARDAVSVLLRAGVEVSVPVARRSLERGRALGEGDLEMEVRTKWGSLDEMPEPCALGWVTQRRIEAGEVLVQPGVKPPLMVESGRTVQALWTNGRVELKLQARAMGSGSMGQRVYVRTEDGTRLSGVVQGSGLVVISNSWMERGE
jgi:flagella basal body P-ring formation protein FlgA